MNRHRLIDERSLAFGKVIAERVARQPELIARARATTVRWLETCSAGSRSTLEEWLMALNGPSEGVIALLTGSDERAARLRQSSPFAGVLTPQERTAIVRQFASHDAAPA